MSCKRVPDCRAMLHLLGTHPTQGRYVVPQGDLDRHRDRSLLEARYSRAAASSEVGRKAAAAGNVRPLLGARNTPSDRIRAASVSLRADEVARSVPGAAKCAGRSDAACELASARQGSLEPARPCVLLRRAHRLGDSSHAGRSEIEFENGPHAVSQLRATRDLCFDPHSPRLLISIVDRGSRR